MVSIQQYNTIILQLTFYLNIKVISYKLREMMFLSMGRKTSFLLYFSFRITKSQLCVACVSCKCQTGGHVLVVSSLRQLFGVFCTHISCSCSKLLVLEIQHAINIILTDLTTCIHWFSSLLPFSDFFFS